MRRETKNTARFSGLEKDITLRSEYDKRHQRILLESDDSSTRYTSTSSNVLKIYSRDTLTGALGSGASYQTNMNPSMIRIKVENLNPQSTMELDTAAVLAHEIWESVRWSWFHPGPGHIDSDPGKIGGVFSTNGCKEVCNALGMP